MDTNEMTIGELTGDDVVSVDASAPYADAVDLLASKDIGAVAVFRNGAPSGIISERDVVRGVAAGVDFAERTAGEVASTELVWADAAASIEDVAGEMQRRWVRHVLVETDGELVGIVSARDLLGAVVAASSLD